MTLFRRVAFAVLASTLPVASAVAADPMTLPTSTLIGLPLY